MSAMHPDFSAAVSRLESALSDDGRRVDRRGRSRFVGRSTDKEVATLRAVVRASDFYLINCGMEICEGDRIVFLREHMAYESAQYSMTGFRRRRGSRRSSLRITEAEVTALRLGTPGKPGVLHMVFADGHSNAMNAADVARYGAWRAVWDNETIRDGRIAECLFQSNAAMENDLRFGAYAS